MTDLDQFTLKELANNPSVVIEINGELVVAVPLELLRRVTDQFDVEHVRAELRGPRYRQ